VNKRNSNRSKITTVTDLSGNDVINDTDIANVFNDYFASVGMRAITTRLLSDIGMFRN